MKESERGFTLIELLVVTAIVAIIAGAVSMSIFQIVRVSERSNNHMTAVRQVQNAGYWITNGVMMAQNIVPGDDPDTPELEFVRLEWTNWENGELHSIIFIFYDIGDGQKELKQRHLIQDSDGVEIGNEMTFVARYIDSASLVQQGGTWKLSVQASSGTETKAREYEVNPRINM